MKTPKIFAAIAAAMMLLASSVNAEPKAIDFLDGVDWTSKIITVTGTGIAPDTARNSTQARNSTTRSMVFPAVCTASERRLQTRFQSGLRLRSDATAIFTARSFGLRK